MEGAEPLGERRRQGRKGWREQADANTEETPSWGEGRITQELTSRKGWWELVPIAPCGSQPGGPVGRENIRRMCP